MPRGCLVGCPLPLERGPTGPALAEGADGAPPDSRDWERERPAHGPKLGLVRRWCAEGLPGKLSSPLEVGPAGLELAASADGRPLAPHGGVEGIGDGGANRSAVRVIRGPMGLVNAGVHPRPGLEFSLWRMQILVAG